MDEPPFPEILGVEFRRAAGWPGYAVSSDGRAWSCKKRGSSRPLAAWHEMILRLMPDGYMTAHVSRDQKSRHVPVHRLVLEAFVGPCPEGMESCHFPDRDKTNNAVANLLWGTPTLNAQHRVLHGTNNNVIGEKHGRAVLTEQDVLTIRELAKAGVLHQSLAERFETTRFNIRNVVYGRTWKHLLQQGG